MIASVCLNTSSEISTFLRALPIPGIIEARSLRLPIFLIWAICPMKSLKNQLVAWDMWPRGEQGRYQWQIKGDVPYQIETARKLPKAEEYRVHIIKEKDICVVYINDEIVLSTRMYNHKDGYAGIYVVQGNVKLIQYKEKRSE